MWAAPTSNLSFLPSSMWLLKGSVHPNHKETNCPSQSKLVHNHDSFNFKLLTFLLSTRSNSGEQNTICAAIVFYLPISCTHFLLLLWWYNEIKPSAWLDFTMDYVFFVLGWTYPLILIMQNWWGSVKFSLNACDAARFSYNTSCRGTFASCKTCTWSDKFHLYDLKLQRSVYKHWGNI